MLCHTGTFVGMSAGHIAILSGWLPPGHAVHGESNGFHSDKPIVASLLLSNESPVPRQCCVDHHVDDGGILIVVLVEALWFWPRQGRQIPIWSMY